MKASWRYGRDLWINGTVPLIQQIEQSHDKPFMTDGLPQLLLYLAGISSKWNQEDKNLLSPNYHCKKRIICGSIDYDQLIKRLTK